MSRYIHIYEAFSGIGSQIRALQKIFGKSKIKSVGCVDWFIDAIVGYSALNFKNNKYDNTKSPNQEDLYSLSSDSKKPVTKQFLSKNLNKIKEYIDRAFCSGFSFDVNKVNGACVPSGISIFTYSFPCQDLSVQGKQRGLDKDSKTRSSLIWQIGRILSEMKENNISLPKYLLMENVPNVYSKKFKNGFDEWEKFLESLGYKSKRLLLNAADYGSPQSRQRAFLVSWLNREPNFDIILKKTKRSNIKSILESKVDEKYYLDNLLQYKRTDFKLTKSNIRKCTLLNYTKFNSENYIYDPNYCGPTLTASGANSRIKIIDNERIRYLTPIELTRYMGFVDDDYHKFKETKWLTDNKIVYLLGNSISIELLEAIFRGIDFNE